MRKFNCFCIILLQIKCHLAFVVPGQRTEGFEVRNYRNYYLQAEKVEWDYLPYQQNLVDFYDKYLNDTLINQANRVGSKYTKYVYKRYTDGNYTQEIPTHQSFGYVGPLLHGEVGEVIRVHFRNKVDRPVSVHPHGVRYDKLNEGALYTDNTKQNYHVDDSVQPGSEITLTWKLTSDFSPRDGDPNCIPFAYHPHVDPDREINAGLLGLVIVCKQGILNNNNKRTDVDKEFMLYFDSINEGESWLVDENLKRCQDPAECKRLYDSGDPDFEESLKKDSVNGYMYGNMPDLDICDGDKVAWYIFSLSAELHPVNIHGQTFIENHHRESVVSIWSATFRAAEMIARNPGKWLIQCMNSEHNRNGMKVFLTVKSCQSRNTGPNQLSGKVRHFFFAAEMEECDYAPSGRNLYDNKDLTEPGSDSELYYSKRVNGKKLIGRKYKKARFFEYKFIQYGVKINRTQREDHIGILGPVLRAEVGDTIEIVLLNLTPKPVSIFLQGTSLNSSENGMWIKDPSNNNGKGHTVKPGKIGSYVFTVPWAVAPGTDDPDCLTYLYYSSYDMERDVSSGLVGPLLICKPGSLDSYTGRQKYVDREMFLYISSIDENFSWYLDDNINTYIKDTVDKADEDFIESNVMRSINGRAYGNLEGLDVCKDEKVVWHIISFGQTEGNHGVTFNGNNVLIDGVYRDSHVIISGVGLSAIMKPSNVGIWSIHCHNDNHYNEGLKVLYHVHSCGQSTTNFYQKNGITRRYYIAVVERKWNYSPKTIHPLTGENYTDPSHPQYNRIQKDGKYIGSIYTKALYREYTDATFIQEKPITAESWHLGVLGPFIKAEVGDVIEVVFKNMATRNYSIHAQGLRYNKTYEGMKYEDGTPVKVGDGVPVGSMFTYRWEVPETSGPGANGPNCINYMYHSAVDPVKDTYAGLVGPIVVCRSGVLDANGKRTDSVEKEFALLFQAFDENRSWYLSQNILENCPTADTSTDDFEESNKYDSINGLIYNNVEGLVANRGENIAWYILGLGENEDIHTVHFHGQTYTYRTGQIHEGDVIEVFPGTYETVEMFASNPGTWLFHCHVGEHMRDGMVGTFKIL
ncbi:ferroxidase HEPHL1-like [Mercenaria mercenaria]|uniref:ferroxidase HEPHL1-like n=1 Tax=Mercenaria mercenaria TaxID=6596 RepID=UPI00234ED29C|nr:ferroxidase HEPHL1-like [Mercenaria mercenaria]